MDWNDDGVGRLRGPRAPHRLPRRPRRHVPLADAVLPDARPRRRLRHHRLLRASIRGSARSRRLRRVDPHGAGSRHARDRRPRRQPHVRPASVVPSARRSRDVAVPRLLRVARRAAEEAGGDRLPRRGGQRLGARRAHRPVLPAQLLPAPARPQHRQPRGARRDREDDRLLAGARRLGVPGRRRAVPHRAARGRRDRRPARVPARPPAVPAAPVERGGAARRGEPALRAAARVLRRRTGDGRARPCSSTSSSMQALYLSLAREDAAPLAESLATRPAARARGAVGELRAQPRRAHARQADATRSAQEVFDAFAPDEWQRVYGRGIIRRLPPMLDGDPRRIRMVYSLLFSLPGTPVLFYGEEIGMGENPDAARAGRPCARRCSGPTSRTAASRGARRAGCARRPPDGRLRARARQRRGADARRRLAARVHPRPRRAVPRLARDRLGRVRGAASGSDAVLAHRITADVGRFVALHNFAPDPDGGAARARPGRARHAAVRPARTSTATTSTSAAASTCSSTPTGSAGSASSSPTTGGSPEAT